MLMKFKEFEYLNTKWIIKTFRIALKFKAYSQKYIFPDEEGGIFYHIRGSIFQRKYVKLTGMVTEVI